MRPAPPAGEVETAGASAITGSHRRVEAEPEPGPLWSGVRWAENSLLVLLVSGLVVLPIFEVVTRGTGAPSTSLLVQHLTLWLGMLGAALAAREGRHLVIAPIAERLRGRTLTVARVLSSSATGAVAVAIAVAGARLALVMRSSPQKIAGVPEWIWALAVPLGFGLLALRCLLRPEIGGRWSRLATGVLAAAVLLVGRLPEDTQYQLIWPGILALVAVTLLGAPLYALLGGAALLLYLGAGEPLLAVPSEAYGMFVTSPMLPAIPLFTLAGYVLAEGGASRRLVRLFRALFGALPGGLAIAAAVVCAFFTTFTGGSGVTILALGGLLLPALLQNGYRERYAIGLLTTSGSLGLLFPPSVPVILYGVVAEVSLERLFAGALLPGVLLVAAVAATAWVRGWRGPAASVPFSFAEARAAIWHAKWEFLLPAIVLGGIFGGFTTPLEAAAVTAAYAIGVECFLHRELHFVRELPKVMVNTAALIGGVFTILAVALGLTSYLIDAEVPMQAVEWVQGSIDSRLGFLLALNLFLLVVGCLMDVFSAIVVVVPIITPIAAAYGVDPIHLGVIFIANLELGYLTPPVGLNLFLSGFRFEKPLLSIYRATVPFFLILLAVVIAITYVPGLTAWGVHLIE